MERNITSGKSSRKLGIFGDTTSKEKKTILVASGYEATVRTFVLVLQMRGYLTDVAGTGQEVIEKTKTNQYAAALIDDELPDMGGIDLLLKLAKSKIIKIMITDQPAKALLNGAHGCFVKPVNPEEILSIFLQLM